MPLRVKVCGLRELAHLHQVAEQGASYVGFILFPPSPRHVTLEALTGLVSNVPGHIRSVGVVVDPSDEELELILAAAPLDILQLHGHETPERVAAIALRTGCRVIKVIRVEEAADLAAAQDYVGAADMLMFDTKPPSNAKFPGGHGLPFDWRVLENQRWPKPWVLAGGLDAGNLRAAVELAHPDIIDVSSGVESRPGVKDPKRIAAFLAEAKRLGAMAPEKI